ncbi:unnamed protein product [Darwinula stevensoni]|uniref:Uncharacterized protein n=1 Tax=Darwinula stevensoni TaxID=69355 RepID=A0A7R8WZ80_9CRUS|nr:unnamed protein product [Darwinula stevensoni]CAG0880258.1 unnamed protein product [Darwinula stevensoni]
MIAKILVLLCVVALGSCGYPLGVDEAKVSVHQDDQHFAYRVDETNVKKHAYVHPVAYADHAPFVHGAPYGYGVGHVKSYGYAAPAPIVHGYHHYRAPYAFSYGYGGVTPAIRGLGYHHGYIH